MTTSSLPAESGNDNTLRPVEVAPNPNPRCPSCGAVEAWHGVVTEPDESPRSACDECGHVEDTLYGWEARYVEATEEHFTEVDPDDHGEGQLINPVTDIQFLQGLEDVALARTLKQRAGIMARLAGERDRKFALAFAEGVRRALWEVEHRVRTGGPSRRVFPQTALAKRFEVSFQGGALYVEPGLLAFRWGEFLQVGPVEVVSVREMSRREDEAHELGRRAGRMEGLER